MICNKRTGNIEKEKGKDQVQSIFLIEKKILKNVLNVIVFIGAEGIGQCRKNNPEIKMRKNLK